MSIEPEKIKAFTDILSGIAQFYSGIIPGLEAFRVKVSGDQSVINASLAADYLHPRAIEQLGLLLDKISAIVETTIINLFNSGILDTIVNFATQIPQDKINSLSVISDVLKLAANLMEALMPDKSILDNLKLINERSGKGTLGLGIVREDKYLTQTIDNVALQNYFTYLGSLGPTIKTIITDLLGDSGLGEFIKQAGKIDSKSIAKIQALAPALQAFASLFGIISETLKPQLSQQISKGTKLINGNIETYENVVPVAIKAADKMDDLSIAFDKMIPIIETSLSKLLALNIDTSEASLKRIEALATMMSSVMTIVSSMSNILKFIDDQTKTDGAILWFLNTFKPESVADTFKIIGDKIGSFLDDVLSLGEGTIMGAINGLAKAGYLFLEGDAAKKIAERITNLSNIASLISSFTTALKNINDAIGKEGFPNISSDTGIKMAAKIDDFKDFFDKIYNKLIGTVDEKGKISLLQDIQNKSKKLVNLSAVGDAISNAFGKNAQSSLSKAGTNIASYDSAITFFNNQTNTFKEHLKIIYDNFMNKNLLGQIETMLAELKGYFSQPIIADLDVAIGALNDGASAKLSGLATGASELSEKLESLWKSYGMLSRLSGQFVADSIEGVRVTGDQKLKAEIVAPRINVDLKVDIVLSDKFVEKLESKMVLREGSGIQGAFNAVTQKTAEAYDDKLGNNKISAEFKNWKNFYEKIVNNG